MSPINGIHSKFKPKTKIARLLFSSGFSPETDFSERISDFLVLLVEKIFLGFFNSYPRYAGPREAMFHALVRRNYGCSHFLVGRDHAGIGNYYGKYDSQNLLKEESDLEIDILAISEPRYCNICCKITTERTCKHNNSVEEINGRDIRRYLQERLVPGTSVRFLRKELAMLLDRIVFSDSGVDKETDEKEPKSFLHDPVQ